MSYIDTSVLVSYYCPEPRSERTERVFASTAVRGVSWLVRAEFTATITSKMRAGEMSGPEALRVHARFREHLRAAVLELWPIGYDDFARADELLGDLSLGLRTLDGVHLAIAVGRGEELITADRRLADAAEKLGLPVRFVE